MVDRRVYKDNIATDGAQVHYGDCYVQGPVTVFTAAASATNLIGLLGRTLDNVYAVRHLPDLDFILPIMVSQLTVWRAALTKIREWAEIESEVEGDHYEILSPLSSILGSCQMLATKVDGGIQEVQKLSTAVGLVTENEDFQTSIAEMGKLQNFMDRQTSTLNLLLTACNT
jgi:hypothetical protein